MDISPMGDIPIQRLSQEAVYLQPTIQLQELAKGAEVEPDQPNIPAVSAWPRNNPRRRTPAWLDRNKATLGWIAAGYIAFRMITRRR
ncbi:MAG: hypothetical protein U5K69_13140 [Balneolaceae bacterium]|nr:hypothetical protein [Balneolaceae bacterium]